MGFDFRFPNITGATEKERLSQVESYLYQFVEQLQWAMNNIAQDQVTQAATPSNASASSASKPMDANTTFDAIKPLIIKSADIVKAYYDEISSRLEGEYVAESDFGTFKEQTSQDIVENSTKIEQFFSNMQEITTDIENINFTLLAVNAHIKSGLLYEDEDGVPVYGLEIGQKNYLDGVEVFNKYARFTSDRLTFYDQNDTEVAYISNYKLYITHAEVTGTLKLGGFLIDTSKGFTLKWVGRG